MIAMLAAAPVRRRNFTAIDVDKHIKRIGAEFWLTFNPDETKGHNTIREPLPRDLTANIEDYLNVYRPILLDRARRFGLGLKTERLWLSEDGSPLTCSGIYQIIIHRTRDRFGEAINPHAFRHCAQTAWAMDDPATSQGGKALLDHASFKTTREAYERGVSLAAAEKYQATIDRRRCTAAPANCMGESGRRTRPPHR
jgi:integrase